MSSSSRFPPLEATAEQAARIERADAALAAAPEDVDALVEAALAREEVWRYEEAIELYSRGMELAPGDYRMPLGRAHRLLRLRRLEEALGDLERARELDPYGFNTAYLGALTRYLLGEFEAAASEYARARELSRSSELRARAAAGTLEGDPRHVGHIETDPATRAAFTAWYYRTLRRAGRHEDARELLETVASDETPSEPESGSYPGTLIRPDSNEHYFRTLLFYRGLRSEADVLNREELGAQWATVAYGVACWHLLAGNVDEASALYREILATPHWARLGHVAAEADLDRLSQPP